MATDRHTGHSAERFNDFDRRLIAAVQGGLPIVEDPYAAVAADLGVDESRVRQRLGDWVTDGTIRRLGVVVRHRELGITSNAMAVWDIPDDEAGAIGRAMCGFPFVTLCYRRRRSPPDWPYNLYCMVHGSDRETVLRQLADLNSSLGLQRHPHTVLFSTHCHKQRGARYV